MSRKRQMLNAVADELVCPRLAVLFPSLYLPTLGVIRRALLCIALSLSRAAFQKGGRCE